MNHITYKDIYIGGDYLEKNPTWHAEESPFKSKYILRMLEHNNLAPRTICEVGCGAGEVLKQLQLRMSADCEFWGYEISPVAHELSRPRENARLHFKLADLKEEENAFYDLMLVLDVIEHVEDYFALLRKLRFRSRYKIFHFPLDISVQAVLRKNGLITRREKYAHIHYFTLELALQVLRDTGYEIADYFYAARSNEIGPTLLQKVFIIPRAAFFAFHKDLAVRILGGYSLMILAQ